jgi:signal transduction histidine kinase
MGMLVIPIISRARNLGSIVIGGKLSGEGYVRKDIDLVENFSTQFATAYEKAALYAKVAAYSEHLEQKVEERTLEVERLREEERQTMHDISHGLQTPLTILKNEIESLRQGSPGIPELAAVERSIDVTSKFVNDLLKLSRLELNQDAPLERLDLSELLLDLVEYIEIVAAEQNISIRSSIEDRCEVRGSGEDLREAFTNVISNAVKYMGKEGAEMRTIEITATAAAKPGW